MKWKTMSSAFFWDVMQRIVKKYKKKEAFFLYFLTLEDGTDRYSRNISNELPRYAAYRGNSFIPGS